jgi:hypothetical protein
LSWRWAGGDISGPPLEVSHCDRAGLVEVDQSPLLGIGGVDLVVQVGAFAASS